MTLNSGNGTAPFASLISNSGDVIANADRISIGANGAISTLGLTGKVMLRPASEGWAIDLGQRHRLRLRARTLRRRTRPHLHADPRPRWAGCRPGHGFRELSPLHAADVIIQSGTDSSPMPVSSCGHRQSAIAGGRRYRADRRLQRRCRRQLHRIRRFRRRPIRAREAPRSSMRGFVAAVQFTGGADSDTLFGGQARGHPGWSRRRRHAPGRSGDDTYESTTSATR